MKKKLAKNNYLYVPNFLNSEETNELVKAFYTAREEGWAVPDSQCPSSLSSYDLLPCVKMFVKKLPDAIKLCGEDLLPTYTYGRIYQKGEILARHRDRDACEISLTINLKKDKKDWPIWIQKPNGEEVSVNLNPGDAMMYLGCIADHWREPYEGEEQVQVFFHYVMANGPRAYTVFDKSRIYKVEKTA